MNKPENYYDKCQIFTPAENVIELLDAAGYKENLFEKKVLENACGDGNILKEVVRRYIQDALNQNKTLSEIQLGLETNIYGFEIDSKHHQKCIKNLDDIANTYNIKDVHWKIFQKDFLKTKLTNKFDFVVGNPPYIVYKELSIDDRQYLKKHFESCNKGKFDYCYAFIEASLNALHKNGILAYLIPSSIFKNVFAKNLRQILLKHITTILDYTTKKLFENALIAAAILVCKKDSNSSNLTYKDIENKKTIKIKKELLSDKWIFSNETLINNKKRFGDYFKASITVATLLNEVFILKDYNYKDNYIFVDGYKIEKDLIREACSPRGLNSNRKELIIFPYQYINDKLIKYTEDDFEKLYPEATKYFKHNIERLNKRKIDSNVKYFEYGRTQALSHLNQEKLLTSIVVTNEVKVYELSTKDIPYSGIFIIPIKDKPLSEAKKLLESDAFLKYVQQIGINANGKSIRITAKDVNNFYF